MLAQTGSGSPPRGEDWLHEIKWDGVRAIVTRDHDLVAIRSRSGREMSANYPEIAAAAAAFAPGLIVDGEIVALDAAGAPSFELLQRRMNLSSPTLVAQAAEAVPVTIVVFDELQHPDSGSMLAMPLADRLDRLAALDLPDVFVRSEAFDDATGLWESARDRGLEGVVSKKRSSPYRPGVRSPDWIKSVAFKSLRAVVGGFTQGGGGRHGGFGALLLGLAAGERLRWIGSVGSGFSAAAVRAIRQALDEMTTTDSPFESQRDLPAGATGVAPALVAVVQYREWTAAGRLRGPSFKGFTDHPAAEVTWEAEGPYSVGG